MPKMTFRHYDTRTGKGQRYQSVSEKEEEEKEEETQTGKLIFKLQL